MLSIFYLVEALCRFTTGVADCNREKGSQQKLQRNTMLKCSECFFLTHVTSKALHQNLVKNLWPAIVQKTNVIFFCKPLFFLAPFSFASKTKKQCTPMQCDAVGKKLWLRQKEEMTRLHVYRSYRVWVYFFLNSCLHACLRKKCSTSLFWNIFIKLQNETRDNETFLFMEQ